MSDPTRDPAHESAPHSSKNSGSNSAGNTDAAGLDLAAGGAVAEPVSAYGTQLDDLHDLFAAPSNAPGSDEEDPLAQLRDDPNYAALIRDLEYIASQARLLFEPADEAPSDEVWTKIKSQLGNEPTER